MNDSDNRTDEDTGSSSGGGGSKGPCGLAAALLPLGMSCRDRAEAFARRLQTKLKTLGSQDTSVTVNELTHLRHQQQLQQHQHQQQQQQQQQQQTSNLSQIFHSSNIESNSTNNLYNFEIELASPGSPIEDICYRRIGDLASTSTSNHCIESQLYEDNVNKCSITTTTTNKKCPQEERRTTSSPTTTTTTTTNSTESIASGASPENGDRDHYDRSTPISSSDDCQYFDPVESSPESEQQIESQSFTNYYDCIDSRASTTIDHRSAGIDQSILITNGRSYPILIDSDSCSESLPNSQSTTSVSTTSAARTPPSSSSNYTIHDHDHTVHSDSDDSDDSDDRIIIGEFYYLPTITKTATYDQDIIPLAPERRSPPEPRLNGHHYKDRKQQQRQQQQQNRQQQQHHLEELFHRKLADLNESIFYKRNLDLDTPFLMHQPQEQQQQQQHLDSSSPTPTPTPESSPERDDGSTTAATMAPGPAPTSTIRYARTCGMGYNIDIPVDGDTSNVSVDQSDACGDSGGAAGGSDQSEFQVRPTELRRSSSLKTGKTPPGTPSRKKIVRFADVLGLDLADVKTFLDEVPVIPKQAYEHLHCTGEQVESMESKLSMDSSDATTTVAEKLLIPMFEQPGGNTNFLELVRTKQVCLENAMVSDPICQTITGTIRVRNLDFNKSVHVRYTLDGWLSFTDFQANYIENSCDGFSDTFSFTIYGNSLQIGQRLEMAIRFACGGQQYWDNNYGLNYCFQCVSPHQMTQFGYESDYDWGVSGKKHSDVSELGELTEETFILTRLPRQDSFAAAFY